MYLSCPTMTSSPAICGPNISLLYFCTKNKVVKWKKAIKARPLDVSPITGIQLQTVVIGDL